MKIAAGDVRGLGVHTQFAVDDDANVTNFEDRPIMFAKYCLLKTLSRVVYAYQYHQYTSHVFAHSIRYT